jgi:dTDP-4-amino-4,6-dideoxygalactose transaminase
MIERGPRRSTGAGDAARMITRCRRRVPRETWIIEYDDPMSLGTPEGVPFLDLSCVNAVVRRFVLADVEEIINSASFINGEHVTTFETEFAEYVGTTAAVGVASGLDALRLALAALHLGPGAEVIVPAMTFVATWEAVSQVGAVPVPVDVSDTDYGMDIRAVEAAVSDRTRAIIPVHLYGQMVDVDGLLAVVEGSGIPLIEDAAQAHGATRAGRRAGATGEASAFSFYPAKNLGAMGDAGALVTNDDELAARVRALREHGQTRKYHHDEIGWTARLDTIQAAVLSRKLPFLGEWNAERRRIAVLYLDALDGVGDLVLPEVPEDSVPAWHLFVVRTANPDGLAAHLKKDGIATGRHYPEPPHLSRAYSSLGYGDGAFPVAEAVARECLSLPIFPGMTESQAMRVAESATDWFERG